MLPNWIIIGAPKAATSTLFRWLVDHPDVTGPREKETYYFSDPGTHMFRRDRNFRDRGLAGYEELFGSCDQSAKVVIEATPGYLYSATALRELPSLPTRPKFIVVIREPVAQLRSLFRYFQQNWNWIPRDMTFGDFIAAVESGRSTFRGNELAANALANAWYSKHLRRWRSAVGSDRMLILLFEELVSDSRAVMNRIASELGIDPSFYDDYTFPRENSTYLARSGALQDLNIWLRARVPQGPFYDAVRQVYRRINTRPAGPQAREPALEATLAERFRPMLAELERDFALDLAPWRVARDAGQPPSSECALPAMTSRSASVGP
jgi:hypothetical protein